MVEKLLGVRSAVLSTTGTSDVSGCSIGSLRCLERCWVLPTPRSQPRQLEVNDALVVKYWAN